MRQPSGFTLALSVVLAASLFFAYSAHQEYLQWTPPSADELAELRMARIMRSVQSSLNDREECLRRDPSDWCNRDMSTAQLVALHSDLYDKMKLAPLYQNPTKDRNFWLGLSAAAAFLLVLRFHYWRRERNDG